MNTNEIKEELQKAFWYQQSDDITKSNMEFFFKAGIDLAIENRNKEIVEMIENRDWVSLEQSRIENDIIKLIQNN